MWMKSLFEFNTKYSEGIECFSIHADPCIVIMKTSVKVPLDSVIVPDSARYIQPDIYKNSNRP